MCNRRLNRALSIRKKPEDLVKIGYLENPVQLGIDRTNQDFAIVRRQLRPDVQEQPQHQGRKELDRLKVENQRGRFIFLNIFLNPCRGGRYRVDITHGG